MSYAQLSEPDTLLKEGFESATFPPTGWLNSSPNNSLWTEAYTYWGNSSFQANTVSHSGGNCALKDGSQAPFTTPDAYLISPKLSISDTTYSLKFWIAASDDILFAEHYSVLVSQTGTNYNDFTPIFSETLTDGSIYNFAFKLRTVSLAAYKGKDIYIAFRHHGCSDQYILRLDDVLVSGTKKIIDYTGISDIKGQEQINIYPNPVANYINITNVNNPIVEIYNNTGQIVLKSNANLINVETLNDGIYTVKVKTENSMIIKHISVIKSL
jgi:hypothetical protein